MYLHGQIKLFGKLQLRCKNFFLLVFISVGIVVIEPYLAYRNALSELEKAGVYFSFGGTSTYSGSKKARRTIAALTVDRIMTETDSPYLPPRSKYGVFPNTPESIPEICANMAEIKGISLKEMSGHVWTSAHSLFKKLEN